MVKYFCDILSIGNMYLRDTSDESSGDVEEVVSTSPVRFGDYY